MFPVIVKPARQNVPGERRRSSDSETNALLFRLFSEVATTHNVVEIKHPSHHFGPLPGGRWPESPSVAYAIPIFSDQHTIAGTLLVGINPRRAFDDDYKGFLELLAGQIGRSIATARAYEAERKRAEALAEIDNAKTLFFSNVSHEFRTPLTLIMGPLEELINESQSFSPIQKERLALIQRNSARLQKLVNCLLDFSKIEAGRAKGTFESVDLAGLTADLASMFRSAFEKAKLAFHVDCPRLSQETYVDTTMWEKIVLNLLSNAFKYTLTGGVTVTLREIGDSAVLSVKDTGTGIPESDLPHVFERFHRVEATKGRSHEGTGIGLALLQELVKLHGGRVELESEIGVGSTFTVFIPLGKNHLPPEQIVETSTTTTASKTGVAYLEEVLRWLPSSGSSSEGETNTPLDGKPIRPGQKSRILLADDNSDMREYVRSLLCEIWDVEAVSNGEEAIQAARKRKPDLILSDVMMPRVDGFQLLTLLKADSVLNTVPVILLSARAGEEAKVEGLHAGADDYLVKPFSAKELIARVNTHLEIGRMRGELERKVQERTEELQKINADLENQIEQRKSIEKALAESEEHFRNLTSISPVGIFHTDSNGTPIYVNPAWTKMTGLQLSQLQGKKWFEKIVHPEDVETVSSIYNKAQFSSLPFSAEFRLLLAENHQLWVLGQLISERSKSGEVIGYIGTITDLTEQKALERDRLVAAKELAQQKTRAEEAEYYRRQQEQFIDMVCHEIRNPLTGVDGNAELMKDVLKAINNILQSEDEASVSPESISTSSIVSPPPSSNRRNTMNSLRKEVSKLIESVDAISECVEHQKLIVNDVLDLSKLEANKIELHIEPFSATDALLSVKKMFETQASKKHIYLDLKAPKEDVLIKGDYARVAQILINLVSNAVKFTHTGGVTMELAVQERSITHSIVRFTVTDTGVGLSLEEKNRLFQRFAQASRSTFAEYGGSGLGLFISKNLARLMQGDILVESEKWKGAKFMVDIKFENPTQNEIQRILATKSSAVRPTSLSPEKNQRPSTPVRILIVEDNRINQQLLSKYFQQTSYLHIIANNGLEAVQQFEESLKNPEDRIDLILMDIEMPGMNGYDAAANIRRIETKINSHVPIIGLSGNARCSQIQKALAVGMDDYITKPFKKDDIFKKITHYLDWDFDPTNSKPTCVMSSPTEQNLAFSNATQLLSASASALSSSSSSIVEMDGLSDDSNKETQRDAKRQRLV